jgi:hypothetical protein
VTDTDNRKLIIQVRLRMENGFVIMEPYGGIRNQKRLQRVLDVPRRTPVWFFDGSVYRTPGTTDKLIGLRFICGGEEHRQRQGSLNAAGFREPLHVYFNLVTVTNTEAITNLFLFGLHTDVVVRLVPQQTAERLILAPGQHCRRCYGQLTGSRALQWRFCDVCADACDHSYVRYLQLADGWLGNMPVCELCHRRDPDWRPNSDLLKELTKTISEGYLDGQLMHLGHGTPPALHGER